ncbi:MAG: hypothetical protein Q9173_006669 [Seirophora scorigena]
MSCSLVGEDFTDKYMIEIQCEESGDASDTSSVASTTGSSESSGASTDADSIHDAGHLYLDMNASHLTAVSTAILRVGTAEVDVQDQFMAREDKFFWENAPAHLRLARTPSILDRIFHYAMQGTGGKILMPRITGDRCTAGIATGLLAISHDLYHHCRDTLYRDNEFIVDNYGSGLQYLSKPMGVSVCRFGCQTRPIIQTLRLIVGCEDHDWQGVWKSEMMTQALKDISHPITVTRLRVDLSPFCFLGNKDLAEFADVLKDKLKVTSTFELCGADVHWEWDLRVIPKAMGMKLEPTVIDFRHHSVQQQAHGWFGSLYNPAQSENERLGLDAEGKELEIRDGKYYYATCQNWLLGKLSNAQ